ncbi:hypothetical protein HKD37_06G017178 [Glycine soja]
MQTPQLFLLFIKKIKKNVYQIRTILILMHLLLHLLLVVSHKRTKCFPCCTWSPSFPRVEISASSPSQAKEQDDDTKPLWTYVTKIKSGGGGGNYEIKCNICDVTFNGSYTRVGAHLLKIIRKRVRGCQKITNAKLIDLKKIDNEATLRVEKSKTKFVIASGFYSTPKGYKHSWC